MLINWQSPSRNTPAAVFLWGLALVLVGGALYWLLASGQGGNNGNVDVIVPAGTQVKVGAEMRGKTSISRTVRDDGTLKYRVRLPVGKQELSIVSPGGTRTSVTVDVKKGYMPSLYRWKDGSLRAVRP